MERRVSMENCVMKMEGRETDAGYGRNGYAVITPVTKNAGAESRYAG